MSQSNVCGYVKDDAEHNAIFTETMSVQKFARRFPNGVFFDCYETTDELSKGLDTYRGWIQIRVKNNQLWFEWGEPAA